MDKKPYVNMRDIAKLAGVSISTVSRVLNAPETAKEETREKVLRIIKEYDYVPNQEARNLFSKTSNSIAVFVFNMANPFYSNLISHLNRIAFAYNHTLLIYDSSDSFEHEVKFYEYCRSVRVSGIIYTAGSSRDAISSQYTNSSIPVVLIDRGVFKDYPCYVVQSDHRKGMRLLVNYLHKLGHRNIGYITGTPGVISTKQRLEDFIEQTAQKGLNIPSSHILRGSFSTECGVHAFDYFYALPDTPTAVITADDQIAKGFIMRANSLGVSIPEEISVCGTDGVDNDYFYPAITSIKQDIEGIAQAAVDLILAHRQNPPPQERIIDVTLRMGQTCRKLQPEQA